MMSHGGEVGGRRKLLLDVIPRGCKQLTGKVQVLLLPALLPKIRKNRTTAAKCK